MLQTHTLKHTTILMKTEMNQMATTVPSNLKIYENL